MKILNLSNIAGITSGGIGSVVQEMIKYHHRIGVKSHLWFPGDNNKLHEVQKLTNSPVANIKAIKTIGPPHLGLVPSLINKRKSVIENFNIVHQHGIFLPISIFTKSISNKVKVIISPHGLLEPQALLAQSWKKSIVRFLYENSNLKKSSCLVACSEKEASNLSSLNFDVPIAILPNGIDENFIKEKTTFQERILFRKTKKIPQEKKILLFISRIHPIKGLPFLLRLILKMKTEIKDADWILVIAGINEKNHEQSLKNFVEKYFLGDIVKFVGPVYGRDKILLYDNASAFVLPSKSENFGIVVIEALARGIPVIASTNTPWSDLTEFKCGWWVKRNEQDFLITLKNLLKLNSSELTKMGESGKKLVKKKYLWESIAEQSVNLYRWILSDYNPKFNFGFKLHKKT
jgi:glycosyltransferase involved in cell wall biosynthesis